MESRKLERRIVFSREDAGGRPQIALTFDDGPSAWTPHILDLLRRYGGRATFFVLGESIAGREDVLRRAAAEGSEIGNHTYSHEHPGFVGDEELRSELTATSELVERALGFAPRLVRPPYGEDAERFTRIALGLGLGPTVLWSIDPKDWLEPPADAIAEHVVRAARPGAIVDLHDGFRTRPDARDRQATVGALERVLPVLAARGYAFLTVSELLADPRRSDSAPP
jgi:peptidoglycan/xylan/chitin deacetylase (PgdA/CDA1 family)